MPNASNQELRRLGTSDLLVTPIGLGCWPMAGMTSGGVNDADSLAAIEASLDAGVNFIDTAYCYGANGESERLIGQVLARRRDEAVLATKGGIHWVDGRQRRNARPERLKWELDESLLRLGLDHVDLLYLHAPDPEVPVSESAGALLELQQAGKTRAVGASNFTAAELSAFHAVCPLAAYQPHYNMLQREIEAEIVPWCLAQHVSLVVYWPLMKGLLAGKLSRDHVFPPEDGRSRYPMFQGQEWQKNQDFVDQLRPIAEQCGKTVAQLAVNWTMHRPGVASALCGAKRADQAHDNAGALGWQLTPDQLHRIDLAIASRGSVVSRSPT